MKYNTHKSSAVFFFPKKLALFLCKSGSATQKNPKTTLKTKSTAEILYHMEWPLHQLAHFFKKTLCLNSLCMTDYDRSVVLGQDQQEKAVFAIRY